MDLGFRDGIDFRGYPGFMDQRLYGAMWGGRVYSGHTGSEWFHRA